MATFRSLETLFRTKDWTNTAWIHNSLVLYALLFVSGMLLFGWMHLGHFHHVIVFVLTGLLAMYSTKNMTVVLFWCIAVSSASFFLYFSLQGKEGFEEEEEEEEEEDGVVKEGMENEEDGGQEEKDEGQEDKDAGEDQDQEGEDEAKKEKKGIKGASMKGSLQAQAQSIVA